MSDINLLQMLLPKGTGIEDLELKPFQPICFYDEHMDWFFYFAEDTAMVECPSKDSHIDILTDVDWNFVGMKIMWFSSLPNYMRAKFKEATGFYPEDVIDRKIVIPASAIAESRLFKELRLKRARA